jgi:hypothetical protein
MSNKQAMKMKKASQHKHFISISDVLIHTNKLIRELDEKAEQGTLAFAQIYKLKDDLRRLPIDGRVSIGNFPFAQIYKLKDDLRRLVDKLEESIFNMELRERYARKYLWGADSDPDAIPNYDEIAEECEQLDDWHVLVKYPDGDVFAIS